jgi:hypothetical protein
MQVLWCYFEVSKALEELSIDDAHREGSLKSPRTLCILHEVSIELFVLPCKGTKDSQARFGRQVTRNSWPSSYENRSPSLSTRLFE